MTGAGPVRFVALNGSERAAGTTMEALRLAQQHLAARGVLLEVVHLVEHRVVLCDCGRCNSRLDPCPVDDDVVGIVERMVAADGVLYAAPVHGFGTSAVMQAFIERAGVGLLRFTRPLANKVGGALVVGRRYAHVDVHSQLLQNLMLNRFIVPGSGFPAVIHAGGPQVVGDDEEGLAAMRQMLDRMAELAAALRLAGLRGERLERRIGVLA